MRQSKLKLLPPADGRSNFRYKTAESILDEHGLPSYLLGTSAKIDKCTAYNVRARILYLTPGMFCPFASSACRDVCNAHSSGRMHMPDQVTARDKRSALYIAEQPYFIARLKGELHLLEADAMRAKMQPAARLNGASDILWEVHHSELFQQFSRIQFYDYTKSRARMMRSVSGNSCWPDNYHLTFSVDAETPNVHRQVSSILDNGGNVAVPFHSEIPATWNGYPVIDGDTHDARFLDPKGHIVALRVKGLAKRQPHRFSFDASAAVAA